MRALMVALMVFVLAGCGGGSIFITETPSVTATAVPSATNTPEPPTPTAELDNNVYGPFNSGYDLRDGRDQKVHEDGRVITVPSHFVLDMRFAPGLAPPHGRLVVDRSEDYDTLLELQVDWVVGDLCFTTDYVMPLSAFDNHENSKYLVVLDYFLDVEVINALEPYNEHFIGFYVELRDKSTSNADMLSLPLGVLNPDGNRHRAFYLVDPTVERDASVSYCLKFLGGLRGTMRIDSMEVLFTGPGYDLSGDSTVDW